MTTDYISKAQPLTSPLPRLVSHSTRIVHSTLLQSTLVSPGNIPSPFSGTVHLFPMFLFVKLARLIQIKIKMRQHSKANVYARTKYIYYTKLTASLTMEYLS